MDRASSTQIEAVGTALGRFRDFATDAALWKELRKPEACDFMFGNPHELPLPGYVEALTKGTQPTGPQHYAYTMDLPQATAAIATRLRERFGLDFVAEDVHMTNGNFSGLAIVLRTVVDPGDEVIFLSPPWFFYEALIVAAGATAVRVSIDRATFDLDLKAIEAAITPRTRAIIVNSPHNPTGRIYPAALLGDLAGLLDEASSRNGRRIYLLSDEAYNRIVFDGRDFPTPLAHYPHSFLLYTYAKTLLSPGSRLGYVATRTGMAGADELRRSLLLAQITYGWAFPVAPLQHAVPELEELSADIASLQRRRDVLVSALREQGYQAVSPEGTFYIVVRSPLDDDEVFSAKLREHDVFVLPGAMFEMPGWFRISVTANDDMVDRAIPGFAKSIAEARA
jgi:aspartate aminotransferase